MLSAHTDIFIFLTDATIQMQLSSLSVEVDLVDLDRKRSFFALRKT